MSPLVVETQEARSQSVRLTAESLSVDLVDARTIIVPLVWFPRLWHGTPQERNHFEIFGDGAYIHWPDLDEDPTVAGLLGGRQSGENPQFLLKWLNTRKGKQTGAQRREPSNQRMQPADAPAVRYLARGVSSDE